MESEGYNVKKYNYISCLSVDGEYEETVGYNDIGITYDYKKIEKPVYSSKETTTGTVKKPVNGKYDLIRVIGTI